MIRVGAVFWHDVGGGKRRPCVVLSAEPEAGHALVVYGTTKNREHVDQVTVEVRTRDANRMGLRSTTYFQGGARALRFIDLATIQWDGKHTASVGVLVAIREIVDLPLRE